MNFRQLDLNLLRVLAVLHRTRSVTAAGKSLALSQSATSNALARLRRCFGDELFVRSPRGLQPTQRCEVLAPAVLEHLRSLEALLEGRDHFEPATTDRHWKLSLSDVGEMLFLPPLAARLRTESPRASLSNVSVAASEVAAALEAREIDAAIGILHPRHRGVHADLLFREQYVAITAPGWRPPGGGRSRSLAFEQLADASLVVASPTATFHGSVEQMLVRMKLAHRIVLRARHFGALPELTHTTDLVAVVPDMYARKLEERYDLRVWRLPQAPMYDVRLVWHASTTSDPAHQWLRAQLHELFSRVPTSGQAGRGAASPG
ncbi:MAG: transcriptional regulator, LysR family-like protein [Ramlibacter sp.]|jgi:DNA-binding transcriptional LysR family regulator|nr:transcriptional regulator, LysR family-like protein [Ramlibacter sp.]MDB5914860.1 transcriptional regulator, LysR family-like protein [Ramlibacter sp.]